MQHASNYDYLFAGAGASASLLLLALHKRGLLRGKKVLILDPDAKLQNDKTYCFWARLEEPLLADLGPLINAQWSKLEVAGQPPQDLDNQVYARISSLTLYEHLRRLGEQEGWERRMGKVERVGSNDHGAWAEVGGERIQARRILDSRPPEPGTVGPNEVHLWQSFVGWQVRTEAPAFDPTCFSMMDFEVPQAGNTQFVYVLPTSPHEALVEFTRFGAEKITDAQAEEALGAYIASRWGRAQVLAQERGQIPMSTAAHRSADLPHVWNLGGRAGRIKPSTGYAFKSMYEWSETAATEWSAPLPPEGRQRPRHRFYDRLLLSILHHEPHRGKGLFEKLFAQQKPARIFEFLDEKMPLAQELRMLVLLPWAPFLRAIVRQHPQTLRALLLTVLTLLLLSLGGTEHAQSWTGDLLTLLGLVWIGLPHGAVDHLLETGSLQPQKLPRFVAHYLGLAAAMGVVWVLAPVAGLALFLIYSAGHFGQADGQTWGWGAPRSWAWGVSVLFYLLGTHAAETSAIVHALCGRHWTLILPPWTLLLWLPWTLREKNTSWQITLLWLVLSAWLPLLLAFGLYFVGQHSWNGWSHLQRGTGRTARALWLQSLPFHLGAWLLLGLALWLWPQFSPFSPSPTVPAAAAPFFVFLSCISFPHVWAMHRFYGRKINV